MGRLRKVTDDLSVSARSVMIAGFIARTPAAEIAMQIKDATGEEVAERTVSRRRQEWQEALDRRQAARERMEDLVAAMQAGNIAASDMIQALAMDKLQEDPDTLTKGQDPLAVQALALEAQKVAQKERSLDLRERAIGVIETKLRLAEDRAARADAAAAELQEKASRGEQITAEQVARIREIYGLNRGSNEQRAAS